ncbi:hypothetical protein PV08_09774 [Exophiala spinifera]|uniref:Uncharacterized protein n=1 Tax=Exophiala spinifera TaxID=91928 RepID=A0A0D1ZHY4_9EURO|nr:uncharacterized protein PV08_09774 [Exophiala spinifera]KIW12497.1 hypothetical protein PV08_09774 [Exophiala spinifera]
MTTITVPTFAVNLNHTEYSASSVRQTKQIETSQEFTLIMTSLLDLPTEIRLQIWSYVVQPTIIYPCRCGRRCTTTQNLPSRDDSCCRPPMTYELCDNRILRVNHLIFAEAQPLVDKAGKDRVFVLCDNLSIDKFFQGLDRRDWKWVKHVTAELFIGWGKDCKDDWFLTQSHRWAKRYVAGSLSKYCQGREVSVQPAEEIKEDSNGRRTLKVDVYLS